MAKQLCQHCRHNCHGPLFWRYSLAAAERWSVRKLRDQMDGMLYERTLISRKPEETIRAELSTVRQGGSISPELVFKSPYFLDFTGLKGYYSEKDLEDMIISGMQQFQMELYLRWLDKYERQPGEESPLGLLLCAAGNDEQIQLLQLGDAGIQVSQYYTELPDKDLLKTQLQKQIAQAKLRLENKKED